MFAQLANNTTKDLTDANTLQGRTYSQIVADAASTAVWETIIDQTIDMSTWLYGETSKHFETILDKPDDNFYEKYCALQFKLTGTLRTVVHQSNHSANLEFTFLGEYLQLASADPGVWCETAINFTTIPILSSNGSGYAFLCYYTRNRSLTLYESAQIGLSTWYGGNGSYTGSVVTVKCMACRR